MNNSTLSLNVVFHGLCVFIAKPGKNENPGVDILLPEVPGHVYRAGTWLGETSIDPGAELTLGGVIPGQAIFERRKNLMLLPKKGEPKENTKRSSVKPYATIHVPRPRCICSLRPVTLTLGEDLDGDFSHVDVKVFSENGKVTQSTVQVLQYTVESEDQVALAGKPSDHRWIPAFHNGVATLHVFAEPETTQPVDHSITEFGAGSALFEGLQLVRKKASILPDIGPIPCTGVARDELEELVPRTSRMALLGRFHTNGEDTNLSWDDADPFGGNLTACVWGIDGS